MWDSGLIRLKGYGTCATPWIGQAAGARRLELLGYSLGTADKVEVTLENEGGEGVSVAGVRAELARSPATVWVEDVSRTGRSRLRFEWSVPGGAVVRVRVGEPRAHGA